MRCYGLLEAGKRLTRTEHLRMLNVALLEELMAHVRRLCALMLCLGLISFPAWSETPALGTVTSAQRAYVGTANASAGTAVFEGDRLSTELVGVVQVRTKAARFQLVQSGTAELSQTQGIPTATLLHGTAVFSTANSKAFLLHASIAEIRAQTDAPTVGQVTFVSPKELLVRSVRGALSITVDSETKTIPEASAYRVILDPDANPPEPAQGPRGAGTRGPAGVPHATGQNRFLLVATAVTIAVTVFAVHEALESPDRP